MYLANLIISSKNAGSPDRTAAFAVGRRLRQHQRLILKSEAWRSSLMLQILQQTWLHAWSDHDLAELEKGDAV